MSTVPAPSPARLALLGSWRDFPIPRHLHRAACLLVELDYTPHAIDAALDRLARFGTAVGNSWIDGEHRDMVEETLSRAPEHEWAAHDGERWTVAGDCANDACTCPVCNEDRLVLAAWVHAESLVDPSAEG